MPDTDEAVAAQHRLPPDGRVLHSETVSQQPWNAATPIAALQQELTPNESFFVRNHVDMPPAGPGDLPAALLHVDPSGVRPQA